MFNLTKKVVVAIDGGAATGKSSLAKELAKTLNIVYIDTGAMYRAITLYFLDKNIEITEENVKKYIDIISVKLSCDNYITKVFLNNEDVSTKIRDNLVSINVSKIAKMSFVREKLVNLQREMSKNTSVVLDGRDIGTVVVPDATLKIFLVASYEKRAKRRQEDLEKLGKYEEVKALEEQLKERDKDDSSRDESPLKKADDAITIDTTFTKVEEVVEKVLDLLKERVEILNEKNS